MLLQQRCYQADPICLQSQHRKLWVLMPDRRQKDVTYSRPIIRVV